MKMSTRCYSPSLFIVAGNDFFEVCRNGDWFFHQVLLHHLPSNLVIDASSKLPQLEDELRSLGMLDEYQESTILLFKYRKIWITVT